MHLKEVGESPWPGISYCYGLGKRKKQRWAVSKSVELVWHRDSVFSVLAFKTRPDPSRPSRMQPEVELNFSQLSFCRFLHRHRNITTGVYDGQQMFLLAQTYRLSTFWAFMDFTEPDPFEQHAPLVQVESAIFNPGILYCSESTDKDLNESVVNASISAIEPGISLQLLGLEQPLGSPLRYLPLSGHGASDLSLPHTALQSQKQSIVEQRPRQPTDMYTIEDGPWNLEQSPETDHDPFLDNLGFLMDAGEQHFEVSLPLNPQNGKSNLHGLHGDTVSVGQPSSSALACDPSQGMAVVPESRPPDTQHLAIRRRKPRTCLRCRVLKRKVFPIMCQIFAH